MAIENAEKFEGLLRGSEGLQAKLRAAMEAFEGDMSDESAVFDAVIAPLAAESGLAFSYEDVEAAAAEFRTLDDAELDAIAGGDEDEDGSSKTGCIAVGISISTDACSDEHLGAGACFIIGAGFLGW